MPDSYTNPDALMIEILLLFRQSLFNSYTNPDALMIEIFRAIYAALESRLHLIGSVVDADVRIGTLNTIPTVSTELIRRTPMIIHRMLSEAWKCHPVSPTLLVLHPLF